MRGCSKLNSITCLAENIGENDFTRDWVSGVSSTGTFVRSAHTEIVNISEDGDSVAANENTWLQGSDKGIPSTWTTHKVFTYFENDDVINVGDEIDLIEMWCINDNEYWSPPKDATVPHKQTLIRANVSGDTVTEDDNRAYYIFKTVYGNDISYSSCKIAVPATPNRLKVSSVGLQEIYGVGNFEKCTLSEN